MASFKSWISALRPRTLFLAVGTAICGNGLAYATDKFNIMVGILTVLIATILQLLSNMANDLGDFQHGTDTTGHRTGPTRTMQSGAITLHEMKNGIRLVILIALIIGGYLIYEASQFMTISTILLFLILGILSIWAAMRYTAGKNPYGYKGYGDIFSFFFFGPVSVVGTFFLNTHHISFQPWLPAIGLGLFTAAVLNINNLRDMDNDRVSGKITLAIRLGETGAKIYHSLLSLGGITCFLLYDYIYVDKWYQHFYLITMLLFIKILMGIYNTKDKHLLDPYLKQTSISAFIVSVLFAICINL